jgi:hypothetical protein
LRILQCTLGGLFFGALAGFLLFLVTTFTPSDIPDDGGGSPGVLLIIAAALAMVGGVLGSSVGLVLGVIWHGLENRIAPIARRERTSRSQESNISRLMTFWDDRGKPVKAVTPDL